MPTSKEADVVYGSAEDDDSKLLHALLPLGQEFLNLQRDANQTKAAHAQEQLRLHARAIEQQGAFFRYKFWLLAFIVFAVLSIASGLIFGFRQFGLGIGILSSVLSLVAGYLAGKGAAERSHNM